MLDRLFRRRDGARFGRVNERVGTSKGGPAPTEEPLSTKSVLRALQALSDTDWVRLAAVENARQANPDSLRDEERIYRSAYASADRRGARYDLQLELEASRQDAIGLARVSAGDEAIAAHARFEAVVGGRGGLFADPADAPAVGRYFAFADAASNAVRAAALRPYISRRDFAYLWRGYATVLDFTMTTEVKANATTADDESKLPDSDRMMFGPYGPEVMSFLLYLGRLNPETWSALVAAHQAAARAQGGAQKQRLVALIEEGGSRGRSREAITTEDVTSAKRLAEQEADKALPAVVDRVASTSDKSRDAIEAAWGPAMRAAANMVITTILVLPFLNDVEVTELWAPWTVIASTPPGFAR